jgi:hypothetical protein
MDANLGPNEPCLENGSEAGGQAGQVGSHYAKKEHAHTVVLATVYCLGNIRKPVGRHRQSIER